MGLNVNTPLRRAFVMAACAGAVYGGALALVSLVTGRYDMIFYASFMGSCAVFATSYAYERAADKARKAIDRRPTEGPGW